MNQTAAPLAAVTLGARVVERHLTLSRDLPGPDHSYAMEPKEFAEMVREIRLFVDSLEGITSMIASDHILNLFEEVQGRLPDAKPRILAVLDRFLALAPEDQCLFQVGRRMGIFNRMADLDSSKRRRKVMAFCDQHGIGPDNVDEMVDEMMKRFI